MIIQVRGSCSWHSEVIGCSQVLKRETGKLGKSLGACDIVCVDSVTHWMHGDTVLTVSLDGCGCDMVCCWLCQSLSVWWHCVSHVDGCGCDMVCCWLCQSLGVWWHCVSHALTHCRLYIGHTCTCTWLLCATLHNIIVCWPEHFNPPRLVYTCCTVLYAGKWSYTWNSLHAFWRSLCLCWNSSYWLSSFVAWSEWNQCLLY